MGRELQHVFEQASTRDKVAAVVVTGAGRAFCAGMDLSASGNVFGLDESLRPALRDLTEQLVIAAINCPAVVSAPLRRSP